MTYGDAILVPFLLEVDKVADFVEALVMASSRRKSDSPSVPSLPSSESSPDYLHEASGPVVEEQVLQNGTPVIPSQQPTLRIIADQNVVSNGDRSAELTLQEYRLLMCFQANPGRVISIDYITNYLGIDSNNPLSVIYIYMHRLRTKLGPLGLTIRNRRGLGYVSDTHCELDASVGLQTPTYPPRRRPLLR